jgi:hypothetical protein
MAFCCGVEVFTPGLVDGPKLVAVPVEVLEAGDGAAGCVGLVVVVGGTNSVTFVVIDPLEVNPSPALPPLIPPLDALPDCASNCCRLLSKSESACVSALVFPLDVTPEEEEPRVARKITTTTPTPATQPHHGIPESAEGF